MSHCEACQIELSAALDGELESGRCLGVLDHLTDCRDCRSFYRQARTLEGMLEAAGRVPATQELPAGGWRGVVERLPSPSAADDRGRVPFQVAAAAAVTLFIVMAVVLAPLPRRPAREVGTTSLEAEQDAELAAVVVGSRRGRMSEERFLALAKEILESDRRYRREIVDLLTAVESEVPSERTTEESAPTAEGERPRGESAWDPLEGESRESDVRIRFW